MLSAEDSKRKILQLHALSTEDSTDILTNDNYYKKKRKKKDINSARLESKNWKTDNCDKAK